MNLKSLVVIIIAIAVGSIAYYLGTKPSSGPEGINSNLLPSLSEQLNDVTKLTILEANHTLLAVISKADKNWVVENRDNYIADIGAVRKTFNNLAEAKLIEAKTSNPDNYKKLGVEDVTKPNAQGVQIVIDGLDQEVNIILGNKGKAGDKTQYIRRVGEQQSWLINKNLDLNKDATNWLKKDILDIPPERIKSIQIKHSDESVIDLENKGTEQFEFVLLNSLPEDKKVSESEIYQVANALSSLQLTDVVSSEKIEAESVKHVLTTFQTFDGLSIEANSYIIDDQMYTKLQIKFNPDLVDASKSNNQNADSGYDAAVRSDPEAAQALATKVGPKLDGWAYILPTITQEALIKTLDSFAVDEKS